MKTFLTLLLLTASVALASEPMPYHPYRYVGGKYISLKPVYEWIATHPAKTETKNPMPEWIGYTPNPALAPTYKIKGVWPDGLLIQSETSPLYPEHKNTFFLKNYPAWTNKVDGQEIKFLAIRAGNHQYKDHDGAIRTVALYDYGHPYDPATKRQQQNSPSNHEER